MFKKNITFIVLLFLSPVFLSAGNNTIIGKADGSVEPFNYDEVLPAQKAKMVNKSFVRGSYQMPLGTEGLLDTVYQRDYWPQIDSRFGWQGQDVMIQWFKAPSEMILKSVGFGEAPSPEPNLATQVKIKLVSVNWAESQLIAATTDSAKHLGYYEAPGNGYNNAAPLINDFDGINTWSIWHSLDSTIYMNQPFGTDIWSDGGMGVFVAVDPLNASNNYNDPTYHWVDMNLLGYEPTILKDQIFGIAIINSDTTVDDYWVRTWSTNLNIPWGAFKYYANGRFIPGVDFGWWARLFAWDFAYVADIVSSPIWYINVTHLNTTLSTDPQTVIAIVDNGNPGGTTVASVNLFWSTDGMTTWDSTAMVNTTGYTYSGDIPGQSPGTVIDYYVKVTDIYGYIFTSHLNQYRIFQPSGAPTLLVFNGYDIETGYPQSYYFGIDDFVNNSTFDFWHDVWAYGVLTTEVVNNYTSIIEITTTGPLAINDAVIGTWIAASADHHYMLAGDEWLGAQSGWPVSLQHFAGEFMYDILGIEWEYNDIVLNYTVTSLVHPVDGSLLGDSLFYLFSQNTTDSMLYDPIGENIVVNWLDGVGFLGDVVVDINAISSRPENVGQTFAIGGHRTLPAGNKIAFLAYDPLSLNSSPVYYWYGFSSTAPQVQFLRWIGFFPHNSLEDIESLPEKFDLSQNYPNPFNPVTKIEYSIAKTAKVELIVFDILGKEVAKLVNETKPAGKYEVNFDASTLSSGLYFYKLKSGEFIQFRKMLLVK